MKNDREGIRGWRRVTDDTQWSDEWDIELIEEARGTLRDWMF
jgi:hypothetical protein